MYKVFQNHLRECLSLFLEKFLWLLKLEKKIAIIGPNGSGKSTLLSCILGSNLSGVEPNEGECKWAENAQISFMRQDVYPDFENEKTLTKWMQNFASDDDDDQTLRSVLGRLLFSGDEVKKAVKVISGGEKHRMYFGKIMLEKSNVIFMDEPTNHLDMESIESLQLALEKYPGTAIVVSHDREFVNAIANRIWILDGKGSVEDFKGSYDEYLKSQGLES
jgi:ATPase subunit of ABC transporter with duplicated ATPase domains